MSIIGPRPLLVRYLPYYTENERHRHDVRPGLTGWAQINGRNFITWEEIFSLDVFYVNHLSFNRLSNVMIFEYDKEKAVGNNPMYYESRKRNEKFYKFEKIYSYKQYCT